MAARHAPPREKREGGKKEKQEMDVDLFYFSPLSLAFPPSLFRESWKYSSLGQEMSF